MPDVFISYKREEREAVAIIAQKLTDVKLDVWFDTKLHAGATFDDEIATQLKNSKAVLTCWTPAAIASEWVRSETSFAHQQSKLVACFLEPTQLIPPFNLVHAEDLTTWAGQDDAPPWLKLLERLGQITARNGLSTYRSLFAPETTVATLRAWVQANGDDPLAPGIWDRIALMEGEGSAQRIAREKAEAQQQAQRRRLQDAKSRALAKERGIRSGRALPVRFLVVTGSVLLIALLAITYVIDSQRRESALNEAATPKAVQAFMARNSWHPIAASAHRKLAQMDDAAWQQIAATPSLADIDRYLATFPAGLHQHDAEQAKAKAARIRDVQSLLARVGQYKGPASGALDPATTDAITSFQYARGMVVNGEVDDALLNKLNGEVQHLKQVKPDDLIAKTTDPPTAAEYRDIAGRLSVDAPTLEAIRAVESGASGFDSAKRPRILFERHIFSRLTGHRFDGTNPEVSNTSAGGYKTGDAEWARVKAAFALDPDAAYSATSFGMFQILGMLHKNVGFETAAEYAHYVSQSEANQVDVFARFLIHQGYLRSMQCLDWPGFARGFNGPNFARNNYAERLRTAYAAAAQKYGADPSPSRPGCS